MVKADYTIASCLFSQSYWAQGSNVHIPEAKVLDCFLTPGLNDQGMLLQ